MNKDNSPYKMIGEVAAELEIPDTTIRAWEKEFPIMVPSLKRGAVRYYTANDIAIVRAIRDQLYFNNCSHADLKQAINNGFLSDLAEKREKKVPVFPLVVKRSEESKRKLLEAIGELQVIKANLDTLL